MSDPKLEINKVNDPAFWKQRLLDADKMKLLHSSVYQISQHEWDKIEKDHLKLIQEHIKSEDKVLDAGCGYGRLAPYCTNYVGIDLSPDLIERARTLYPDKEFIVGDCRNLPFPDQSFDFAVLISFKHMIIYYLGLPEYEKMEKELKRVAKKLLVLEYTDTNNIEII
jgi:ubiquinone/menaquinone biosynthesis C-methylase UbiE